MLDLTIVRVIFVLVLAITAYFLRPFGWSPIVGAIAGLVLGAGIIFFEIRLEKISLKRLIGAAAGSVLGIIGAFFMTLVLSSTHKADPFIQVGLLLWMTYVGMIVGAKK